MSVDRSHDERERSVDRLAWLSRLLHARERRDADEVQRAERELARLGVSIRFADGRKAVRHAR